MSRSLRLCTILALALAGFVLLALTYDQDPLASLDEDTAEWVAAHVPSWLEALARPFSWIGGWVGVTALCVVVILVLGRERAWLDLAFFAVVLAGSQLLVVFFKATFDRSRPDAGSAIRLPESASFPSGHATTGVAVFGAAAVLAAERIASPHARRRVWAAAFALGIGIGLSRVVLNVHYVTDVLAEWCLGLAWLAACLLVRDVVVQRRARSAPVGVVIGDPPRA